MKSIKMRIALVILPMIILLCAIFGGTSCFLNYRTASSLLEENMSELAIVASDYVAAEIKAIQTGCTAQISNCETPLAEKEVSYRRWNMSGRDSRLMGTLKLRAWMP